jgi:hypothetical protein
MSSENESANHVVVFRTGKVWEFDIARDALRHQDIPFFAQADNVSGVRTAVDVMPTPGPGVFWSLLVPQRSALRAQKILRQCHLDVENTPLIWDFNPVPEGKTFWKLYAGFVLMISILVLILWAIQMFR